MGEGREDEGQGGVPQSVQHHHHLLHHEASPRQDSLRLQEQAPAGHQEGGIFHQDLRESHHLGSSGEVEGGRARPNLPGVRQIFDRDPGGDVRRALAAHITEMQVRMSWKFCLMFYLFRVCQLPYRYILQYENLSDDWRQLLLSAEITEDLDLVWENRSGGGDLTHYYEAISDEEIIKLFDKFESDFVMFGYTLNGYLNH